MNLIETGKIVNTHGIHGDLKIMPWAQTPDVLLDIEIFYIENKAYTVEKARLHKGCALIKFSGINDVETAERFKNKIIYADKKNFDLDEGEYFINDLIGLEVIDEDTQISYGIIKDVLITGANDVYDVVDEKGMHRLVPAIKDCIKRTDIENNVMYIRPLEGLFDL